MTAFDIQSLARSVLRLGDVRVDVGRMCVVGRGDDGRLTPKSLAVLIELARHPLRTVTRTELLDRVWPDSQPTPDALSHAVRELRRALGDDARAPRMIDTVHGLGYRLLVSVAVEDARSDAFEPSTDAPSAAIALDTVPAVTEDRGHPVVRARPSAWFVVAVFVVAILLGIAAYVLWLARRAEPAAATAVAQWNARLITSDPGAEEFPRLSPDGAFVAFTRRTTADGRYDLAIMSVTGSEPIALTETPSTDELWPVWSPDGASLAYVHIDTDQCSIRIIPATGGAARSVSACDRVVFSSIDWSPDKSHLLTALPSDAAGRELRLHRVALAGGAAPLEYSAGRPGWDRDPIYSPDGERIAFRRGLPPDYDVFVMPAGGGEARQLTRLGTIGEGLTWSADGRDIVFWSQHEGPPALYRVDAESGVVRSTGLTNATRPHIARDRSRLVFQRPWLRVGMAAASVSDASAPVESLSESTGSVGFIASSPDHRRLAYVSDRAGFEQVWIHEPEGGADRAFGDRSLVRITSLDWSDDSCCLLVVARRGNADHALVLELAKGEFEEISLQRPLLRDALLGEDMDRVYAIVEGEERPMLARFDREAEGWRETRTEIPATELIRLPGVAGVFARTPLRADVIQQIGPDLTLREIALEPRVYGWTAAGGAIWYLSTAQRASVALRRFDLASGEDHAVRRMPHHLPRRRATLAMLGDRIVVPVLAHDAADIGVVDDAR